MNYVAVVEHDQEGISQITIVKDEDKLEVWRKAERLFLAKIKQVDPSLTLEELQDAYCENRYNGTECMIELHGVHEDDGLC